MYESYLFAFPFLFQISNQTWPLLSAKFKWTDECCLVGLKREKLPFLVREREPTVCIVLGEGGFHASLLPGFFGLVGFCGSFESPNRLGCGCLVSSVLIRWVFSFSVFSL
jgi:hypothetical protein